MSHIGNVKTTSYHRSKNKAATTSAHYRVENEAATSMTHHYDSPSLMRVRPLCTNGCGSTIREKSSCSERLSILAWSSSAFSRMFEVCAPSVTPRCAFTRAWYLSVTMIKRYDESSECTTARQHKMRQLATTQERSTDGGAVLPTL